MELQVRSMAKSNMGTSKAAERYAGFHRGWTWKDAGGSNVLFHQTTCVIRQKVTTKAGPDKHNPLTAVKEFRAIKNVIIQEVTFAFSSKILLHDFTNLHLCYSIQKPPSASSIRISLWVQASNCFTRWGKFSTTPPRHQQPDGHLRDLNSRVNLMQSGWRQDKQMPMAVAEQVLAICRNVLLNMKRKGGKTESVFAWHPKMLLKHLFVRWRSSCHTSVGWFYICNPLSLLLKAST